MIQKFRKKPVEVEAIKYTGDNPHEIKTFTKGQAQETMGDFLVISTLEGDMQANVGDWIIKGVKGEFYPIKDDIFKETYEPVD